MRSIAVIQRAFLSLVHFFLFYYDEKSGLSAEGVAKHTTAMCRRSIGEDPFNADNQEERNEHDKKLISITKPWPPFLKGEEKGDFFMSF